MAAPTLAQLNISIFSVALRKLIRAKLCSTSASSNPPSLASPGIGMKMVTRTTARGHLPKKIEAEFNFALAAVGQDLIFGSPIYPSGHIALQRFRIFLASIGIPGEELDRLSMSDISFPKVTLSHQIHCASPEAAANLIECIEAHVRILGLPIDVDCTENILKIKAEGHTISFYINQEAPDHNWPDHAPIKLMQEAAKSIVRVDLALSSNLVIKDRFLMSAPHWNDTKTILCEPLWEVAQCALGIWMLRNTAPTEEAISILTKTEAAVLDDYMKGGNPRNFPNIALCKYPGKRYSKIRNRILLIAEIDINIEWAKHTKLDCTKLQELTGYRSEYDLAADFAPWSLCEANRAKIYRKLRDAYKNACKGLS